MNKQQRIAYSEKTKRRMKLFEREYLRGMYDIIQAEFKRSAEAVREGTIQAYMNQPDIIEGLGPYLYRMYETLGLFYARKTLREIEGQAQEKGFGFDQEWIDKIKEYFQTYLLNKAVWPISDTTKADILSILTKGEQEGWGIDKMAFELEHSDFPVWRARMIVRTELLKAQNYGKEIGEETSIWETVKEWVSAEDHRVRHSHRLADGQTRKSGEKFAVSKVKGGFDMMTGPGDPSASAENVINCRCTTTVRPLRDKNGRLVRKRKIFVALPGELPRARAAILV